ncbi:MAG: AAA family ATPase [Thiobacillus sp.]|nr:AAA family ATPase [Thiobacillus sp.]
MERVDPVVEQTGFAALFYVSYGDPINSARSPLVKAPAKAPTGITGFDEITGGGLLRGRTALLVGGPGSGKTLFALQFLVHGAQDCKEPGIFVAFEENARRIVSNAES